VRTGHTSRNPRIQLDQARAACKRNQLFLLVEAQPGREWQHRWALLCLETGRQVATYFPKSRCLLLVGEETERLCKNWWEAVRIAATRRAAMARRLKERTAR
jgi:hypothetical protein